MMMKMPQIVSKQYIAQTRWLFHCHIKIKIPLEMQSGEAILEESFQLLEKIEAQYNSYHKGSFFDTINKNAGTWTTVDDECMQMIHTLKFVSELTNGSYDITCMPLIRLWGFYNTEKQAIPSLSSIQEVLKHVNYATIYTQNKQVKIAVSQEIITGSFIKAFAVDKVITLLKEKGVTDAIVNAGGSTIMAINKESHPHWKINIPDPSNHGKYIEKITLHNQCFSLSGRINNNLLIDGKSYGHILNSRTGFPATNQQVGIITKDAFIGDILSTALFSLDEDSLDTTIKRLQNHFEFDYFLITENGTKLASPCF